MENLYTPGDDPMLYTCKEFKKGLYRADKEGYRLLERIMNVIRRKYGLKYPAAWAEVKNTFPTCVTKEYLDEISADNELKKEVAEGDWLIYQARANGESGEEEVEAGVGGEEEAVREPERVIEGGNHGETEDREGYSTLDEIRWAVRAYGRYRASEKRPNPKSAPTDGAYAFFDMATRSISDVTKLLSSLELKEQAQNDGTTVNRVREARAVEQLRERIEREVSAIPVDP